MSRSRTLSLVLIGLLVSVTACYNYDRITPGEVGHYGKVRVWMVSGEREVIHEPRLEGDSIKGKDAAAVSLFQVAGIEAMDLNVEGTVLVVGAVVLGAVAVGVLVADLVSCSPSRDLYCP